jgi:bifunctional non-homologous end joining protein LigD
MLATAVRAPPDGPAWLHEFKADGFRAQVHLDRGDATIYSRNGRDIARRFRAILPVLAKFPAKRSAIIDAELVACDDAGLPCFEKLIGYRHGEAPLCLWCFTLDGVRLMPLPLTERKKRLADMVAAADTEHIQFSGSFPDAQKLLAACERMGMEGIVSKVANSPYRPGRSPD